MESLILKMPIQALITDYCFETLKNSECFEEFLEKTKMYREDLPVERAQVVWDDYCEDQAYRHGEDYGRHD